VTTVPPSDERALRDYFRLAAEDDRVPVGALRRVALELYRIGFQARTDGLGDDEGQRLASEWLMRGIAACDPDPRAVELLCASLERSALVLKLDHLRRRDEGES
jgi:hypothetical protein